MWTPSKTKPDDCGIGTLPTIVGGSDPDQQHLRYSCLPMEDGGYGVIDVICAYILFLSGDPKLSFDSDNRWLQCKSMRRQSRTPRSGDDVRLEHPNSQLQTQRLQGRPISRMYY